MQECIIGKNSNSATANIIVNRMMKMSVGSSCQVQGTGYIIQRHNSKLGNIRESPYVCRLHRGERIVPGHKIHG